MHKLWNFDINLYCFHHSFVASLKKEDSRGSYFSPEKRAETYMIITDRIDPAIPDMNHGAEITSKIGAVKDNTLPFSGEQFYSNTFISDALVEKNRSTCEETIRAIAEDARSKTTAHGQRGDS